MSASREAPYIAPTFGTNGFNCPHCYAFANQDWGGVYVHTGGQFASFPGYDIGRCTRCGKFSLWHEKIMLYPEVLQTPESNPDLPEHIQEIYREAEAIFNRSPKGAAALLRLCIQLVCIELGEKGKKIDDDIASLVKKGLPQRIQQALDIVRVVGNDAVHPGQINLDDNRDLALTLFDLVNVIAQDRISEPKRIEAIYASLPQSKREAIDRRDGSKSTN